jgi:hypothetical protein
VTSTDVASVAKPTGGELRTGWDMSHSETLRSVWDLHHDNAVTHGTASAVAGRTLPPCPICLRPVWPPASGPAPPGAVVASRGHVWPGAAGEDGDRGVVLECEPCNNRFGRWFDLPYDTQVKHDRFRSGLLPAEGVAALFRRQGQWVLVNGHMAWSEVSAEVDGLALSIHVDADFPGLSGKVPSIALRDPPVPRVIASLLHSAYLRLVWYLGYEYVTAPGVRELREDLAWAVCGGRCPADADLMRRFAGYAPAILRQERPPEWQDLGVLCQPSTCAAFTVFIPGVESRAYIVFLPGFGLAATGLRERLRAAEGEEVRVRQVVGDADRQLRLLNPRESNWGRKFWADALGSGG